MPITIRDISRSLNLSHTTVSRVLNDRNAISIPDRTRERVRQAAKQMGYTPNRSARALATGRTHLVALQMHRLSSPYASKVSQEMQRIVNRDGYEVLVREFGRGDLTVQSSVDGILALDRVGMPLGVDKDEDLHTAVPYVLLGALNPPSQMLDCVEVDLRVGAQQATQHLIGLGRRRIAHMAGADPSRTGDARLDGYKSIMNAAGLPIEIIETQMDFRSQGYTMLLKYVASHGCPDALFCRNDELASGCLRALHQLGRKIPDDVAVIGCDDIEEGEYLQPALSTIGSSVSEMCRIAWQFLRQRIADQNVPRQFATLPSSLILRASA